MISLVADQTRREHVKLMEKTKKGSGTTDLTVGRPLPQILKFALPLVLGTLFQQLYSLVDTLVIGQVEGVTALAAVSAAGWLDWLVLGLAMGLAQGFSIQVAQCFGAADYTGLRRAVGQSLLLSAADVVLPSCDESCVARLIEHLEVRYDNR